jgi:hypothetical protein
MKEPKQEFGVRNLKVVPALWSIVRNVIDHHADDVTDNVLGDFKIVNGRER